MAPHYSLTKSSRNKNEAGLIPLLALIALGLGAPLALLFVGGVTDCSVTDLSCWGIALGAGIVKVVFGLLAEVAELIYIAVSTVLQWVVRNMLSIPVAPNADGITPVVTKGWELSRSLVNAVLLLILVFIGLATILRFREYELQRTLPRLIIVALLVNFSGVFVGFVVDVANIIANFFFSAVQDISWAVPWPGASGVTGSSLAQIVGSSLGIILYYLIAILIYLAIIIALILRIFVLWILAILAPLAFGLYVLPATRGWWNRWLHSLLTWAFLPVPLGFFLYLAGYTLVNSVGAAFDPAPGDDPNPIIAFMGPFTALFLLFTGLSISISLAPPSIRRAVNFAEKAAMVGVGFLGAQAIGRYFAREKRQRETGEDTVASKAERMTFGIDWKNKKLQSALISVGTLGMAPLARFGLRTGIRKGVEYGAKRGQDFNRKVQEYRQIVRNDPGLALSKSKGGAPGFLGDLDKGAWAVAFAEERGGRGINAFYENDRDGFKKAVKAIGSARPRSMASLLKHVWTDEGEQGAELFGEDAPEIVGMMHERMLGDSVKRDDEGHLILDRRLDRRPEDRDAREVEGLGEVQRELTRIAEQEGPQQWRKDMYIIRETIAKKLAEELKVTDLEALNESIVDNPAFRRAMALWKPQSFLRRLGEEWGAEAIEKIQDEAMRSEASMRDVARNNRSFLRASTTREGEVMMKRFIDPRTGGEITGQNAMRRFIQDMLAEAPITTPTGLTPSSPLTTQEGNWLDAQARSRLRRDPSKRLRQHRAEAEQEYTTQYRENILRQVQNDQGWLQWRIDEGEFTNIADAQEWRMKEVLAQLRRERGFSGITPRLTKQEKEQSQQVASGALAMPQQKTQEVFRIVRGSKQATHHLLREQEKELARAARQLQDAQRELATGTITPTRRGILTNQITGLQRELRDLRQQRDDTERRFTALDRRESQLKTALGIP